MNICYNKNNHYYLDTCWDNYIKRNTIMNTKNNLRYKSSTEKIETAFLTLILQKPFEEILVSDLCKQAKINDSKRISWYRASHGIDRPCYWIICWSGMRRNRIQEERTLECIYYQVLLAFCFLSFSILIKYIGKINYWTFFSS